ncbi:BlaI/MecI/CopY family transcriptional regulator [Oscillospiraceae bacterium 38-13]
MKIDLSNSEWKLMRRLWDHAPRTITELTAALREETGWSKNTVITMLSRLEAKGAVRHEEGLRAKRYFPVLRREDAARDETESFLSRVYGGSLGLMMSAMVESRRLSEADIAELSAILEQAGGGDK